MACIYQLGAAWEQAHRDKEIAIRKKRTTKPQHFASIRHGGKDGQERAADPSADGRPALLLEDW